MSNRELVQHFNDPAHRMFGRAWCGSQPGRNGSDVALNPAEITCKRCLAKFGEYSERETAKIAGAIKTAYATRTEQNFKAFGTNCRVRFDAAGVLRYAVAKTLGCEAALAVLGPMVEASR